MLSHANTLTLIRVTPGDFLGFYWSAGLNFRLMGLGLGGHVSVGGDTRVTLVWNSMLPLTQSIDGL